MTKDVVSVSPSMSVEDLVQFIFQKKHMGYPVMEGNRLRGIVTLTDIERIPDIDRSAAQVSDIMTRDVIISPFDSTSQRRPETYFI